MFRTTTRSLLAAMALAWLLSICSSTAQAAHPDIFYNFYAARGGGVPANLYVSPRPTPPMVGHTWNTYPPLMPHEFMYHHCRSYYKYYRNGGYTVSRVKYH